MIESKIIKAIIFIVASLLIVYIAINIIKNKKKDKNIPKGESFQQSNETNAILNSASELPVLLIPLTLENIDHSKIPVGHYQVEGKRTSLFKTLSVSRCNCANSCRRN